MVHIEKRSLRGMRANACAIKSYLYSGGTNYRLVQIVVTSHSEIKLRHTSVNRLRDAASLGDWITQQIDGEISQEEENTRVGNDQKIIGDKGQLTTGRQSSKKKDKETSDDMHR